MTPGPTGEDERRGARAAELLESYRRAVEKGARAGSISALSVLGALVARDRLAEQGGRLEPAAVLELAACDERLRARAEAITTQLGRRTLAAWQRSADPASERWWWSLHLVPGTPTRLGRWLGRSSVLLLGISFIFMADLVALLLKVTAISEGLAALAVQALLLYVTSRGLTESGLQKLQAALARVPVLERHGRDAASAFMAIASALILTSAVLARSMVPGLLAESYGRRGDVARAQQTWYRAIEDYDRAAVLDPDDAAIHYGLAVACDESRQLERAVEEYTAASRLDGASVDEGNVARFASTINGLARLYIGYRKDPPTALAVLRRLDRPLRRGMLPAAARYLLFRNRGWAKLELGLNGEAEDDLRTALRVQNGASAHFLLGRALLAAKRRDGARAEFNETIRIVQTEPTGERELDPAWIIEAQRRLQEADGT